MSKIDDGGPAFSHGGCASSPGDSLGDGSHPQSGMSLRDWFAGMAIQSLVPPCNLLGFAESISTELAMERMEGIAEAAYALADAMIAEKRRTESAAGGT